MSVEMTRQMRSKLSQQGSTVDPDTLILSFEQWKAGLARGELSVFFGKDYPCREPVIAGQMVLQHVHVVPNSQSIEFVRWMDDFENPDPNVECTSNRALVYADNGAGDYLLIYFLDDPPGAHQTYGNRKTMMHFARIADEFIVHGRIAA